MPLAAGTKLGPYEITAPIGAGGMGEVYRATDTRLGRTVAIKVLPEHLADRADLRERFEREAKAVSSLNHPHICTLFDVGEQDGIHYLVMEYVDGETLQQRLEKGRLPLDQALEYAIQIADALDKAHRQGVVHRDLKPGNIMITKSGTKLLDFGLAKLKGDVAQVSPLSQMPTQDASAPLTAEGTIIGTLQYMAPEQLEGKEADARTDIFAFGAVVYEMVTGKKAFEGKSQASLIAAIIEREPVPISELQTMTPPSLDHVVGRCLGKDPEDRWQAASDVMREMMWVAGGGTQIETVSVESGPSSRERIGWIAVTAVLLIAVSILAITRVEPPPGNAVRFVIPLPPEAIPDRVEISPDGKQLAYFAPDTDGNLVVWVIDIESGQAQVLEGTEGGLALFWSPDGGHIGIIDWSSQVRTVDLSGRLVQTVYDGGLVGDATWNRDGVIVLAASYDQHLYRIHSAAGEATALDVGDGLGSEAQRVAPHFLPDGIHFLYTASLSPSVGRSAVYVGSLESGESTFLFEVNSKVLYADGYLLFVRRGVLMARRFDPVSRQLQGDERIVDRQVVSPDVLPFAAAGFSVSQNGILAVRSGTGVDGQLVWFDQQGQELARVPQPQSGEYVNPSISPNGQQVAVNRIDPSSGNVDIWLIDAERDSETRFTTAPSFDADPVWSPDGETIAFTSDRNGTFGIWMKEIDGGDARLLHETPLSQATHWSPDGQFILYDKENGVWVLPVSGDEDPWVLLDSDFIVYGARFSPDGGWVAYSSTETGKPEVYVVSFPEGRNKQRISTDGGIHPRWKRDGTALFYWGNEIVATVMAVGVGVDSTGLHFRVPEPAIKPRFMGLGDDRNNYAVTSDGERFLLRRPSLDPPPVTIIVNWTAELEEK